SIPRQQQQIQQEHQKLIAALDEMQHTFADYQLKVLADFQEQREYFQSSLHAWQEESSQQMTRVEARLDQEQKRLQEQLAAAEQRRLQDGEQLQQNITRMEQHFDQEQRLFAQTLTQAQADLRQQNLDFHEAWREQQQAFAAYQNRAQQALENLAATQNA